VAGEEGSKQRGLGGIRAAAQLLNGLERGHQERLLREIGKRDPELAGKLRRERVVFEDLAGLQDAELRELLASLAPGVLALALRVAPESVREAVFRNLSKRAGENLKEEIELLPPTRRSEIDAAQAEIVERIRKLKDR
jgi:flagellar motor switch protein FliG